MSKDIILFVDDKEPVRQEIRMLLEAEGFRVLEAADHHVPNPFHNQELGARIREVLHRARRFSFDGEQDYQDSTLTIESKAYRLILNDHKVQLAPKEWRVLDYLVSHKDQAVSREELLSHAWGPGYENDRQHVKVVISHLRDKLGEDPENPRYIHTVRGYGYMFESHV